MREGLKIVQVPGRYGYSVTLVGWVRRVQGDEWEMLPGHYTVTRLSGRATLDELAERGPGTDHRLYGPARHPEELHRLLVRRPKPASEKAWPQCPKPDGWVEK